MQIRLKYIKNVEQGDGVSEKLCIFASVNMQIGQDMEARTPVPQAPQMIVTLDDNAVVADIRKALKLIRGVASVRFTRTSAGHSLTPAIRRSIAKARKESASGETIVCKTPEEMQKYFDSL